MSTWGGWWRLPARSHQPHKFRASEDLPDFNRTPSPGLPGEIEAVELHLYSVM